MTTDDARAPRARVTCFVLVSLLGAGACAPPATDPDGPPPVVETVALDGMLLMETIGPRQTTIHLFDPSTGRSSREWILFAGPREAQRSAAPDGRYVAFFDVGGVLQIGRPVSVDGVPDLEIVHVIPDVLAGSFRWGDDDALYLPRSRIDLVSGEVHTCPSGLPDVHRIVPLAGTRDYFCPVSVGALHRFTEGRFAGTLEGVALTDVSPDGQFVGASLHLPSGVQRAYVGDELGSTSDHARLSLPDGRVLFAPAGAHGEVVVVGFSGLETTYMRVVVDTLPPPARALDPAAVYASGVVRDDGTRWDVEAALTPYFGLGTGRRYEPLFVRGDGSAIVYSVRSHVVEARRTAVEVSLVEVPVDSALVEVFADGTSRGLVTSATGVQAIVFDDDRAEDDGSRHLASRRYVDLGDGDWLVRGWSRDARELLRPTVWGYRDGRAIVVDDITATVTTAPMIFSPDGGWLIGLHDTGVIGATLQVCLRSLRGVGSGCVEPPTAGTPIAVVGQGQRASAEAGSLVLGLSRVAAPAGAEVVVYGARLGTSGTLTVGDVTVPAADIVAWEDHRIRFRTSAALPTVGRLRVDTGRDATTRVFHLGRSPSVTTPFDGVPRGPFALGQGLNLVDLGDLGAAGSFVGSSGVGMVGVTPEARQADGRFALFSTGGEDEALTIPIGSEPYSRVLDFVLEDRIAAEGRWQPVLPQAVHEHSAFVSLAGDLVERSLGQHPIVGSRMSVGVISLGPIEDGRRRQQIPEYFREDAGRTFVSLGHSGIRVQYPGWPMRELTGFTSDAGEWGAPRYATTPSLGLPDYHRHFAVDGDTVLVVGQNPDGSGGPSFALSADGAATLGPVQLVSASQLPTTSALMEPVRVRATSGAFFLVFEVEASGGGAPRGVHAIDAAGTLVTDVIAVPPGASISGYSTLTHTPMLETTDGARVLLHFGATRTMVLADFDADVPSWTVVPSAADAGRVRSFHRDAATGDVLAVRVDGTLARATRASGWTDWAPLDLAIDLGVDADVVPLAAAQLPTGRWVVLARWLAPGSSDEGAFFGSSGWLLGPR